MMMPSIFGEDLFDDFMGFPFDRGLEPEDIHRENGRKIS